MIDYLLLLTFSTRNCYVLKKEFPAYLHANRKWLPVCASIDHIGCVTWGGGKFNNSVMHMCKLDFFVI